MAKYFWFLIRSRMGHSLPSSHVTMIPPERVMALGVSAALGFPTHLKARRKVTANNSNDDDVQCP